MIKIVPNFITNKWFYKNTHEEFNKNIKLSFCFCHNKNKRATF
jgi:hypothetical protein